MLKKVPSIPHDLNQLRLYVETLKPLFPGLEDYTLKVAYIYGNSCFGQCFYQSKTIKINRKITCPIEFLDTVLHELAHMYCGLIFDKKGHCKIWKQALQSSFDAIGLERQAQRLAPVTAKLDRGSKRRFPNNRYHLNSVPFKQWCLRHGKQVTAVNLVLFTQSA